ncbi:MAG: type II toxin-antitoxin system VapC family toxin [Ardenticatenaceae bacterium]|nr:type II toxin-antitoxin system VapC family toxin [Anaerolineales bacterium]MCB8977255.1 type II toxin-antitoxin system VapC family toxin [Ardenticatenaceae bacterium]
MTSQICIDSGILLKLLLNEPDSHLAEALWRGWVMAGVQPIAPHLFWFEVTAVLRKLTHRGLIQTEIAEKMLEKALQFDVTLQTFDGIHARAWQLATEFGRPTAYDTHYLALAEHLGCPFWTADLRLFNAVHDKLEWVYFLGNFKMESEA